MKLINKSLSFLIFIMILNIYTNISNGSLETVSNKSVNNGIQLPYRNETIEKGELVFFNGTVLTMDDSLPRAEAVLVKDGIIIAVDSTENILKISKSEAKKIDLKGKTLLPGFIDAHSHWLNNHDPYGTIEDSIELSIRQGWTTITSMFTEPALIQELSQLSEQGKIRNRINLYLRLSWHYQRWTDWYKEYLPGEMLSPKVRVVGVKIFADGDVASGTMAMNEPWLGAVDENGSLYFTQNELNQLVKQVNEDGYQIAIHVLGDRAVDQVLNAYEYILKNDTNNQYRHRIEHLLFLNDAQIARISKAGIVASFQFHWAGSDYYEYYKGYFGSKRMENLARWRDLIDSGAVCVADTDYPYCFLYNTAIQGIFVSTTRIGPEFNTPVPDILLKQRITAEEALKLITIRAAYATFQENMTGSITPGKYADIVILTQNPLKIDPKDILNIKVWMTVIGGKIEYSEENSDSYTLNIKTIGGGGSTIPPPGEYNLPREYVIKINPLIMYWSNVSSIFSHWMLNDKKIVDNHIIIPMQKNYNLTAVYINPKNNSTYTPIIPNTNIAIPEQIDNTDLFIYKFWLLIIFIIICISVTSVIIYLKKK